MGKVYRRLVEKQSGSMSLMNSKPTPVPVMALFKEPRRIWRMEHSESRKGPFTHQGDTVHSGIDMSVVKIDPQWSKVCDLIGGYHLYGWVNPLKMYGMIRYPMGWQEKGFHIHIYDAKRSVVFTDDQCAFQQEDVTLVETISIRELHERMDEYIDQYEF